MSVLASQGEGVQEVGPDRAPSGCARDCDRAESWFLAAICPESEGRERGVHMWIELMFR